MLGRQTAADILLRERH